MARSRRPRAARFARLRARSGGTQRQSRIGAWDGLSSCEAHHLPRWVCCARPTLRSFDLPDVRPHYGPRTGASTGIRRAAVSGRSHGGALRSRATRRALLAVGAGLAALAAGCSGFPGSSFWSGAPPPPTQPSTAIGSGQVKVALILPLSASGNAGVAAQSMKNAAEMALAEFNNPNLQLLVKDDAGTAQGAQAAAQQALDEGAEIILGPLFAHSVGTV